MYSQELDNYIIKRSNETKVEDYLFIIDITKQPQTDHIFHNINNDSFDIWTTDLWNWSIKINKVLNNGGN